MNTRLALLHFSYYPVSNKSQIQCFTISRCLCTYLGGGRHDGDGGILPPAVGAVERLAEGRLHAGLQSKGNLNQMFVCQEIIYNIQLPTYCLK